MKTKKKVPNVIISERQRKFDLFGFGYWLPATSVGSGHQRTPYFYRKQAIAWARHHREGMFRIFGDSTTCLDLAKSYLKTYRLMKGATA